MPLHGTAAILCHSKLASPSQCRVIVPIVLHPASFRDSRQDAPVGVCLATSGAGNSRKLSQAARDYAAGSFFARCIVGDLFFTELNSCDNCEGVRKGIDEDDLVALQLGKARAEELSIVQQKYKDKLKQRLIEVIRWFYCCYSQWLSVFIYFGQRVVHGFSSDCLAHVSCGEAFMLF